ncbi:glycerophosphodiester phosphodiesterase family protein, partial [Acinetobacter baumannii]|uniref:glycerophosphodiester phosphodiesterase family protein n=1 Tax=Acinetobacter baumannii TaxID=470 RepID=UPI0024A6D039
KYQGNLNIEIKTDEYDYEGIEKNILKVIKVNTVPFSIILSSFNTETMLRVIALDTEYEKAIILDKSERKVIFGTDTNEISGLHPSIEWIEDNIEMVRVIKKSLRPWTVNTEKQMLSCFDLELAAFHTDYPEKALYLRAN